MNTKKKELRRRRHARNLAKIVSNARERAERMRPSTATVLRGPERYGVSHMQHDAHVSDFYMCFLRHRSLLYDRVVIRGFGDLPERRWALAVTSVDVVPIVMQATLRGRRIEQIDAEMREVSNRVSYGDIR